MTGLALLACKKHRHGKRSAVRHDAARPEAPAYFGQGQGWESWGLLRKGEGMSKGSHQRPTDHYTFGQNFDKIFSRPKGYMEHKDCGWPMCTCKEKCEELKKETK